MMEEPSVVGDENDGYGDVSLYIFKMLLYSTIKFEVV